MEKPKNCPKCNSDQVVIHTENISADKFKIYVYCDNCKFKAPETTCLIDKKDIGRKIAIDIWNKEL